MPKEKLRSIINETARRRTARPPIDVFTEGDSIDRLEAILAIEAKLQISLNEAELQNLRSLEDLDLVVERTLSEQRTPDNPHEPAATIDLPAVEMPTARWGTGPAHVLTALTRGWFRILCRGADHLPSTEGVLLCANHSSHLDSLALLAAADHGRERMVFAAAKDYFFARPGLISWAARILPMIPWERRGDLTAMRQNLRHLTSCRAAGKIVVFFPEGSRSPDGTLQSFRDGLAFFAYHSKMPVIPCWIDGAYRAMPKGHRWPRPGHLSVTFGPMLQPESDNESFSANVRSTMLSLKPQ